MQHIETLIAQNRLEEALSALLQARPQDKATILTLQNRLGDLKKAEMLGTESYDTITLQKNRLVRSMLQLMAAPPTRPGEEVADEVPIEPPTQPDPSELKQVQAQIADLKAQINQPKPEKKSILFISANPMGTERIQVDYENQQLIDELKRGSADQEFTFLNPELALNKSNFLRIEDKRPYILHFSGHGSEAGICIQDGQNRPKQVPNEVLNLVFEDLANVTQLVVLNSCLSSAQAEIIARHVPYVVGTRVKIKDRLAIAFSAGLYNGLGQGIDIEKAIRRGKKSVAMENPEAIEFFEVWINGKMQ